MKYIYILLLTGISFSLAAQCYPDRHNSSMDGGWISCQTSPNPNPIRGQSHWIMYDLGDYYQLDESTIWNLNNPDFLDAGIRRIVIDYATEEGNWNELGEYLIDRAEARSDYEGVYEVDFQGNYARFVLITVVNNHGNVECAGFSELRIATSNVSSNDEIQRPILSLSPNPVSDQLQVTTEWDNGALYQIMDAQGRVVMNGTMTKNSFLDVSGLPNGFYQIQVKRGAVFSTEKFQVIH